LTRKIIQVFAFYGNNHSYNSLGQPFCVFLHVSLLTFLGRVGKNIMEVKNMEILTIKAGGVEDYHKKHTIHSKM